MGIPYRKMLIKLKNEFLFLSWVFRLSISTKIHREKFKSDVVIYAWEDLKANEIFGEGWTVINKLQCKEKKKKSESLCFFLSFQSCTGLTQDSVTLHESSSPQRKSSKNNL